jgi:pimeloyl-ACP methyl ester carboxylesterase
MAPIERKTCTAPDGVVIAYSVAGAGDPAIVFIHGGLANRTFWDESMMILSERHRIVAPDLPGHGESGTNRTQWGVPEFGADVRAVVLAEGLQRVVLVGNSLGGPVAIEAALLMPRRVLTVVGVDTFHRLAYGVSAEESRRRAEAFRADFVGSLKQMVAGYPGLHDVFRDGDPTADTNRQPVDFYSPDTFNFNVLEVNANGKTLTVTSIGMNSTAQNAGIEYGNGPQARTIFSFKVDAKLGQGDKGEE